VRAFYDDTIVKGGQAFLELDMDRIVVDDETIVTEGDFRAIYHGADAATRGFSVDDPEAFYLLKLRIADRLALRCRRIHHRRGELLRHRRR
jgi:hypothetical protein